MVRLLMASLLLSGCVAHPVHDAPCEVTCAHLARLGCEWAEPSPVDSITCDEVCERSEEFDPYPHRCVRGADSCDAAEECEK